LHEKASNRLENDQKAAILSALPREKGGEVRAGQALAAPRVEEHENSSKMIKTASFYLVPCGGGMCAASDALAAPRLEERRKARKKTSKTARFAPISKT
jgi:hypothetical protein